jgi:uncharacterized repeat protein (TIGR01451 family)
MKTKNFMSFFVAIIALVFLLPSASAFADIDSINVNGISDYGSQDVGVFAGELMDVKVVFTATDSETDARVIARILGEPGLSDMTEEFDLLNGSTYTRTLNIALPSDIEPSETYVLEITIESSSVEADSETITLEVQRPNHVLEILSVESDSEVQAGETVVFDVVVKNIGMHEAEDTYVRASIPSLGISRMVYLEDLSSEDQVDPDKEDSAEGKVYLTIPSDASAGVYDVEIEAYNDDSSAKVTKMIVVSGSGSDSQVITGATTKDFASGESAKYSLTIVNTDDTIKVFEIVPESISGLTIESSDSIVAVPAGSSKTVEFEVTSSREGNYEFSVNVLSSGELVESQGFTANVEGSNAVGDNAAVLLTVVLAIIFVVLLIVLIVLLTRKPNKAEDFGESYY